MEQIKYLIIVSYREGNYQEIKLNNSFFGNYYSSLYISDTVSRNDFYLVL